MLDSEQGMVGPGRGRAEFGRHAPPPTPSGQTPGAAGLRFGRFRLLAPEGPLLRDDCEIRLPPRSLLLLWTLALQLGHVVLREHLLDAVWPDEAVGDEVLTFQIRQLRRAIEDDPRRPRLLLTAHRVGYRLVVPAEASGAQRTPRWSSEKNP